MTKTAIKRELHKAIDIVESEQLLKAVHTILSSEIKHKNEVLKPFTLEEFYARNAQSQKEIKQGKLIEHKTVKNISEKILGKI
ncbi:MAG: hypothetical protein KF900_07740 [Bacteroidetes bacterium]|nr:hypothetical protein [Bacteroidota bacterium]